MNYCIHVVEGHSQLQQLALLYRAIAQYGSFSQKIIYTGRQYEKLISDSFFNGLAIPLPDYVVKMTQLPSYARIGRMTEKIGDLLAKYKDSGVILYGAANVTLAGALAVKTNQLPIAHIEAGIRTGNEQLPEEINRSLVDRLADINFCSTALGKKNLENEGIPAGKIAVTGDIMLDAWKHAWNCIQEGVALERVPAHHYVLTVLEAESPAQLREIAEALNEIQQIIPVLLPCSPAMRKKIKELGIKIHFHLRDHCPHLQMVRLLDHAAFVITDSGSFCREAFFSGKPSLILSEYPCWPEIIEQGQCLPTAATRQDIVNNFTLLQKAPIQYDATIFGNGDAAMQMAAILAQEWSN